MDKLMRYPLHEKFRFERLALCEAKYADVFCCIREPFRFFIILIDVCSDRGPNGTLLTIEAVCSRISLKY